MKINLIKLPADGEVRIKKIISRSNSRPTGKYPSLKMGRMMHWENIDQLYAFRLLDINPAIKSFEESPMEIQYEINGKRFCEYPDLLINTANLKEIWKIQKSTEYKTVSTIENEKTFREQLLKKGFRWRYVDSKILALEPRKQNVITLLRYGAGSINLIEVEKVRNYLERYETISWGKVTSGFLGLSGPKNICRLVIEGQIYFDINQKWSSDTTFHWHKNNAGQLSGANL